MTIELRQILDQIQNQFGVAPWVADESSDSVSIAVSDESLYSSDEFVAYANSLLDYNADQLVSIVYLPESFRPSVAFRPARVAKWLQRTNAIPVYVTGFFASAGVVHCGESGPDRLFWDEAQTKFRGPRLAITGASRTETIGYDERLVA